MNNMDNVHNVDKLGINMGIKEKTLSTRSLNRSKTKGFQERKEDVVTKSEEITDN